MSIIRTSIRNADQIVAGLAVWSVVAASTTLNAWGWSQSAAGLVSLVVVTLVVASEVLGVLFMSRLVQAASSRAWGRVGLGAVLFAGVVAFNAYSGHRAFEMIEAARVAPLQAVAAAEAEIAKIDAKIDALPAVPLTDEAGRSIGPQRTAELGAQRAAEIARLSKLRADASAKLDALPRSTGAASVKPIDAALLWAIVALVEALKAFGLFIVSGALHGAASTTKPAANPARDLANKRWGMRTT
ncbi:MAG: hypothetical protein EBR82_47085 [Caulobacteraceae bacterium]|nr:hypothetical protein [Caulobacteraceae bacterium]